MLNLDFIRHDMTRLCTVIGETGSLRWDGVTGRMEECVASSNKWELVSHLPHQRDDSYRRQWQHFLSSIESEQDPLVNGEEGQATLSIIEAARQSAAAQGGRVSVRRYRMDNPE